MPVLVANPERSKASRKVKVAQIENSFTWSVVGVATVVDDPLAAGGKRACGADVLTTGGSVTWIIWTVWNVLFSRWVAPTQAAETHVMINTPQMICNKQFEFKINFKI